MKKFVNLHCHSDASQLDGMSTVKEIVEYAKHNSGIACITDHRTMANSLLLEQQCKAEGIKPIMACEFNYVTNLETRDRGGHVCLYAQNSTGYKNLCKLVTLSNTKGYYYVPRIDAKMLLDYNEGLICSTGCMANPFIKDALEWSSVETFAIFRELFKDRLFVEIQNHYFDEESRAMGIMSDLAKRYGLPRIATIDSHYTKEEDAKIHRVLLGMSYKKTFNETDSFSGSGYHFLSDSELISRFDAEDIMNTKVLADMIDESVVDWDTDKSPKYRG